MLFIRSFLYTQTASLLHNEEFMHSLWCKLTNILKPKQIKGSTNINLGSSTFDDKDVTLVCLVRVVNHCRRYTLI